MPGMTETLAALHRLHLDLQEVRDQLASGPRQIKVREGRIAAALDEAVRLKEEIRQTRAAADRKSLDLKGREAKVADLKVKLNACSSNREYDILRGQIEADEVASSVLEDEILELLDKVDRLQRDIVDAETKAKTLRRECDDFAAAFALTAAGLNEQAARLQARIAESEQGLQGETLLRYRRLVDAHGADGLASVDASGNCTSCFVSLTSQARVQLGTGQIIFCNSCGRMLYLGAKT